MNEEPEEDQPEKKKPDHGTKKPEGERLPSRRVRRTTPSRGSGWGEG